MKLNLTEEELNNMIELTKDFQNEIKKSNDKLWKNKKTRNDFLTKIAKFNFDMRLDEFKNKFPQFKELDNENLKKKKKS